MNRVPLVQLVQRKLVIPPIELVSAVLQAVRPRDEHLAAARVAHVARPISVEDGQTAHLVGAKPAADLDDHCPLGSELDLDLLARGRDHAAVAQHRLNPRR